MNICNLETSYLFNNEVVDLIGRIQKDISPSLIYVCCFWADHLQYVVIDANDTEIVVELENFLYTHFLHWLEVLSVLKETESAIKALEILKNKIKVCLLI